jgi:ABC-2 type transport system permease protein
MPPQASAANVAGVIHDIGYQPYEGLRLGRGHLLRTLYAHRLRAVFGLGRSIGYRVVPFGLLTLMVLPAVISAAITSLAHVPGIPYGNYAYILQVVLVLFLAAQASQLVTTDFRSRVLTLYFSRPLSRSDYVWTTLAAMATGTFILLGAPLLLLYGGAILGLAHGLGDVVAEAGRMLAALAGALLTSLVISALALAAAAFSRRRAFAVLAVIAPYLVVTSTASIVEGVSRGSVAGSIAGLFSPFELMQGVQAWLLGGRVLLPGVPGSLGPLYVLVAAATLAGAAGVLLIRYRRIDL